MKEENESGQEGPEIKMPEASARIPRRGPDNKADDVGAIDPSRNARANHTIASAMAVAVFVIMCMLAIAGLLMFADPQRVAVAQATATEPATSPVADASVVTSVTTDAFAVSEIEPTEASAPLVAPRPRIDVLASGPNEAGVEYLSGESWDQLSRQFTISREDCAKLFGADFVCKPVVLSMAAVTAAYAVTGEQPVLGVNDYVVFAEPDENGTHQAVLRSCALAAITGLAVAEGQQCPSATITWRHYGQREAMNLAERNKAGAKSGQTSTTPKSAPALKASPNFGEALSVHERRLQALEAKTLQGS